MLNLSRTKIFFVIFVIFFILIFAIPNIFKIDSNKFSFFKEIPRINLGLDLKGGSHLLLEIDTNSYFKEQYNNYKEEIKKELRKNKVKFTDLKSNEEFIEFNLKDDQDVKKIINKIDNFEIENIENHFTVKFSDYKKRDTLDKLAEQSIIIIQKRVDETGTKEPLIQREGDNKILLQIPGLSNPEEVKNLIGKTAKLTFQLLHDPNDSQSAYNVKYMPYMENQSRKLPVNKQIFLTGEHLVDAQVVFQEKTPAVSFKFNNIGTRKFAQVTSEHTGRNLAIILDGVVISAPLIKEPINGGSGIISGSFEIKEASNLALLLRAGALPAPLKVIEERIVGPNLGADSIEAGKIAALVGSLAVIIFMIWTYGIFGVFANLALTVNILSIISIMSAIGATLTMPGIAGMVLTVGMAVDANVLIFERIREEYKNGHSVYKACELGFSNAYSAIFDSNITTLITAGLLYYFGFGAIRGFAVTLTIGIMSSMFSAILLTRLLISIWISKTHPKKLSI